MILFQAQIEEHQRLADHYRELAAKREAFAAGLLAVQEQADSDLSSLKLLLSKCKEVAPSAIASLKTAVLTLFADGDGGNNDGENQPNDPTPDSDPNPECDPEADDFDIIALQGETGDCLTTDDLEDTPDTTKLTYAQMIKRRCSACWGYQVETKADIKAGFVNRTTLNFMEAVNLERSGKDFYQTVEAYLDRLYYNGQSCKLEDCPESSLVGQHYQLTSPLASLLWEDAPLTGQHCTITSSPTEDNQNYCTAEGEAMRFVELIKVTDAIAYQRKHDGEIICCYVGFRTKALAQSWLHFFEAVTSGVELRQAQRIEGCKWEIKAKGLSINQISRYVKDCDFSKSYRSEVCSSKPPSYKELQRPQPVNPDDVGEGDIVTALLTPSASYKIVQMMPNGILDCENLTTGSRLGLRATAVTLVQKGKALNESALVGAAAETDYDF